MVHIGVQLYPADPYWVQVREAIEQRAQHLGMRLTALSIDPSQLRDVRQHQLVAETFLAQGLDGVLSFYTSDELLHHLVHTGIPVVYLNETSVRHRLLATSHGLYEAARLASEYLAERLNGRGQVVVVTGVLQEHDSRLRAVHDVFARHSQLTVQMLPCAVSDVQTRSACRAALQHRSGPIDAIFGLYDSVALMGAEVAHECGLLRDSSVVVGINGDPLALAAILAGRMAATVDTDPAQFGMDAVNLIDQYCRQRHFSTALEYRCHLVTAQNVADIAVQKLVTTAHLPSRLVGINRDEEQRHVSQLETSLAISRQTTSILDRQQLIHTIIERIRDHFDYDRVQLFRWVPQEQVLVHDATDTPLPPVPVDAASPFGQVLLQDTVVFIPDARCSQRFTCDPTCPETVSRVIVPMHLGTTIVGLIDLHSRRAFAHTVQELTGFQLLVDQLGVALHNADLYDEAIQARAQAERADLLKTRLLANVSHELRTPLHIILGYSQAVLTQPHLYERPLPSTLLTDIGHIYRNGEHLIRLINDLLDLSRAEIDALDIYPEPVPASTLLQDVFQSIAEDNATSTVRWHLDIPDQLPYLQADPVRLRQILFNLLSNARKFTDHGTITLGAEVEPPYVRIWVADTGCGIPSDLQERMFEPFMSGEHPQRRRDGAGLGLSIVRRLVALHHGTVTVQSRPEEGSTFNIYLPLPTLDGATAGSHIGEAPVVLLIGATHQSVPLIEQMCARRHLTLRLLSSDDDLDLLFATMRPMALAWDASVSHADDWALVERVRAHPQGAHLPCMLYTHIDDAAHQTIGTTNVLLKPLRVATLLEVVHALRPATATGIVLVVDDDAEARVYYQRLLSDALPGYQILLAQHGREALAILEETVPGLIVLDLMMPEIDGFAVLDAIRSQARTSHVPVVVLSGHALAEHDVRRLAHPRVLFQTKGIMSTHEVTTRLRDLTHESVWLPPQTSMLVKMAVVFIQQHYADATISRHQIAARVGVSESYLTRLFQEEFAMSPWDYLNRFRIRHARELLTSTSATIQTIAEQVGFDDPSYFARVFRRIVGCPPLLYRKRPSHRE